MKKPHDPKKQADFLAITHKKINRKLPKHGFESDLGSPELENHHVLKVEFVDAEGNYADQNKGRKRVRNITQTTLDYCKAYALISEDQHKAGEQLYSDCYYGGMIPRAIATLMDGLPRTGGSGRFSGFAEGRIDAQRRYSRIRQALMKRHIDKERGITFWEVAYQVSITGIPIDELEKWTEWPRRSGKKLIGLVLDAVYEVYDDIHSEQRRSARAW
ncbi:MAG: hypothetical protein EBR02_07950 [Alphaproteobacteria bacterium]|nr:hypothetical protein [Alphaproteobacteria bacterium]